MSTGRNVIGKEIILKFAPRNRMLFRCPSAEIDEFATL